MHEDRIVTFYRENESLNDPLRKKLMYCAAILAVEKFGISLLQYRNLSKVSSAIQRLFPKEFPHEKVILTSDRKGLLYSAAKYRKKIDFPSQRVEPKAEPTVMNNIEIEQDLEFVKQKVQELSYHSAVNIEEIQRDLELTFKYRRQILLENEATDISPLMFNFFWVNPERFINYEFNLIYPHKTDSLKENWPKYDLIMASVLSKRQVKLKPIEKEEIDQFPNEVKMFFYLLKLVGHAPLKRVKRMNTKNDNFVTACSRLVEFYPMNITKEEIMRESSNTQPYILAKYVSDKADVVQYSILLNEIMVPLEKNINFMQAVDFLYKIHHIFNLQYAPSLSRLFSYFDEFIFKIKKLGIPKNLDVNVQVTRAIDDYFCKDSQISWNSDHDAFENGLEWQVEVESDQENVFENR